VSVRERLEAHAEACREALRRGDPRPGLPSDLCYAYLSGAYLSGADLRGAYLRGAYLCDADLRGAYLSVADLRGADLCRADLSGAYLGGAYLRGAYLSGAYLSGAYLSGADLRGAYLRGAYLSGADLRGADLYGADLTDAVGVDDAPRAPIPGLAARVLRQITEHPESWRQEVWHSDCGTAHCCAGWAVTLAGEAGKLAEARMGTASAARLLLGGDGHPFGEDDRKSVIPWLQARVAEEAGQ